MNTFFNQPKCRLYIWTSPDSKTENPIDYILCRNCWSSCLHSARTLPGADCGTDHELLMAELKLRLKIMPRPVFQARNLFSLPLNYSVEVSNRFSTLDTTNMDLDEMWNEMRKAVEYSAENNAPRARRKRRAWMSGLTIHIARERGQGNRWG